MSRLARSVIAPRSDPAEAIERSALSAGRIIALEIRIGRRELRRAEARRASRGTSAPPVRESMCRGTRRDGSSATLPGVRPADDRRPRARDGGPPPGRARTGRRCASADRPAEAMSRIAVNSSTSARLREPLAEHGGEVVVEGLDLKPREVLERLARASPGGRRTSTSSSRAARRRPSATDRWRDRVDAVDRR